MGVSNFSKSNSLLIEKHMKQEGSPPIKEQLRYLLAFKREVNN